MIFGHSFSNEIYLLTKLRCLLCSLGHSRLAVRGAGWFARHARQSGDRKRPSATPSIVNKRLPCLRMLPPSHTDSAISDIALRSRLLTAWVVAQLLHILAYMHS